MLLTQLLGRGSRRLLCMLLSIVLLAPCCLLVEANVEQGMRWIGEIDGLFKLFADGSSDAWRSEFGLRDHEGRGPSGDVQICGPPLDTFSNVRLEPSGQELGHRCANNQLSSVSSHVTNQLSSASDKLNFSGYLCGPNYFYGTVEAVPASCSSTRFGMVRHEESITQLWSNRFNYTLEITKVSDAVINADFAMAMDCGDVHLCHMSGVFFYASSTLSLQGCNRGQAHLMLDGPLVHSSNTSERSELTLRSRKDGEVHNCGVAVSFTAVPPTAAPTPAPTANPTASPTDAPTAEPTRGSARIWFDTKWRRKYN